jgi:uncharacterized protein YdiU (UPF0061 family)
MNTGNMSILGLTIDYGPFGFLDAYDAHFICNHTDEGGRYAFDRQPSIGLWNCNALAIALSSLVSQADAATALASYQTAFRETHLAFLAAKFGLNETHDDDASSTPIALRRYDMAASIIRCSFAHSRHSTWRVHIRVWDCRVPFARCKLVRRLPARPVI